MQRLERLRTRLQPNGTRTVPTFCLRNSPPVLRKQSQYEAGSYNRLLRERVNLRRQNKAYLAAKNRAYDLCQHRCFFTGQEADANTKVELHHLVTSYRNERGELQDELNLTRLPGRVFRNQYSTVSRKFLLGYARPHNRVLRRKDLHKKLHESKEDRNLELRKEKRKGWELRTEVVFRRKVSVLRQELTVRYLYGEQPQIRQKLEIWLKDVQQTYNTKVPPLNLFSPFLFD
jgi:hypothetical protein